MNAIETYRNDFLVYLNEQIKVTEPVNLYEPIHYILQIGGKRLRPVLTLLTCNLFGGNSKNALDAALAVEVFHNFTLIHDDIMDSAPIRRGKETVHKKWNVNTGILSGDAMMILAYQCFENYESSTYKKLMQIFNKTALEVCEGQQLDIDFETRNDVSLEEYIAMITNKTSVLVACAMQMGAIIAEVNEEQAKKIYDFGLNLGIAFQLQDDYLDTFGNEADFGKQIGGDILENKKTFLYLKALEVCDSEDRNKLLAIYNSTEQIPTKKNDVTEIFKANNIPKLTINEITKYSNKAFEILAELAISETSKKALKQFGENLMKRTI
jgi:geranylgeranyl diphosphate synthase type II